MCRVTFVYFRDTLDLSRMSHQRRYRDYAAYLRERFGGRVQKLSIDGGFTCPNRDGTLGTGGCTFCNNESFTPAYCREVGGVRQQIEEGIRFFGHKCRYTGQRYLAYFQSYSGTYASLPVLRERFEVALSHSDVVGLVVGTRPDVVAPEVLDYLEELARERYVCVEYGVESANDEVLRRVNRGHDFECSVRTIQATAGRGIVVGVHLMLGLPGESLSSMLKGVDRVAALPVDVLKLHQLQIVRGTQMAEDYAARPGTFPLYTEEEYLQLVVQVIERLPRHVYLERFVNQSPPDYLIAPLWGAKNFQFTTKLTHLLEERDTWQGKMLNVKLEDL